MGPRGYIRRIHEYRRIGCERWDCTTRVLHIDAVKRRKEWGDKKGLEIKDESSEEALSGGGTCRRGRSTW